MADAWHEMREHPALNWVPPAWRPAKDSDAARAIAHRHRVSALDRNLRVDVIQDAAGVLRVRLTVGPLADHRLSDGVDPLHPAARPDADLVVDARSFEEAVLLLREAVWARYGRASLDSAAPEADIIPRPPNITAAGSESLSDTHLASYTRHIGRHSP